MEKTEKTEAIENKKLSVEEICKQAGITAKDAIRELQESLDHGFMTYPELIRILKFYFLKSITEILIFRPDNLPFSLRKVGLHKIHKALIEKEKRDEVER